jgi:hypothetical protein
MTITLIEIDISIPGETTLIVRFDHHDLPIVDRRFTFRNGDDLLMVSIVPWILAEATRIENLLARSLELEVFLNTDICIPLLGQIDDYIEVIFKSFEKTYDEVKYNVTIKNKIDQSQIDKTFIFNSPNQLTHEALVLKLNQEKNQIVSLTDMTPYISPLLNQDLLAWARSV